MKLKKSEIQELVKAGKEAMEAKLVELRSSLLEEKVRSSRGELKDPHSMRSTRKMIAILSTKLKELK